MKKYDELTAEQQEKSVNVCLDRLLTSIVQGCVRFNDELNQDDLQQRIDAAIEESNKNQTPWFASEFIMETCGDDLRGMAQCSAEDSLYSEKEHVIFGIA